MPGTYSSILLHAVFSTQQRRPWLKEGIQPRLYKFMGGICEKKKTRLFAIGGMPDHTHLLFSLRTDQTIAAVMRDVKANSSKWLRQTFPELARFRWQEGYSVFSVSRSQKAKVEGYIANQARNHRKRDFKAELRAFLDAHEIEYEEQYILD